MAYVRTSGMYHSFDSLVIYHNSLNADYQKYFNLAIEARAKGRNSEAIRYYNLSMEFYNKRARVREHIDDLCGLTPKKRKVGRK